MWKGYKKDKLCFGKECRKKRMIEKASHWENEFSGVEKRIIKLPWICISPFLPKNAEGFLILLFHFILVNRCPVETKLKILKLENGQLRDYKQFLPYRLEIDICLGAELPLFWKGQLGWSIKTHCYLVRLVWWLSLCEKNQCSQLNFS